MDTSSRADSRGYGRIKAAANYIGLSERTVRSLLKTGKLPYFRLPSGTILIAFTDIDEFLQRFRVEDGQDRVNALVDEITREMTSS